MEGAEKQMAVGQEWLTSANPRTPAATVRQGPREVWRPQPTGNPKDLSGLGGSAGMGGTVTGLVAPWTSQEADWEGGGKQPAWLLVPWVGALLP